jgi:hypothetical protein
MVAGGMRRERAISSISVIPGQRAGLWRAGPEHAKKARHGPSPAREVPGPCRPVKLRCRAWAGNRGTRASPARPVRRMAREHVNIYEIFSKIGAMGDRTHDLHHPARPPNHRTSETLLIHNAFGAT